LPLRQLIGSNSARQFIGSKFFQFPQKSTNYPKFLREFFLLFFRRTLGNLMVPKRPAINWFQFPGKVQKGPELLLAIDS
jgi:hypothetical protein